MRHPRRSFLRVRRAAIIIQASWKGHAARQNLWEEHLLAPLLARGSEAKKALQHQRCWAFPRHACLIHDPIRTVVMAGSKNIQEGGCRSGFLLV